VITPRQRAFRDRRVDADHPSAGEVLVGKGVPEPDPPIAGREPARGDLRGEAELMKDLHRADVDQPGTRERRQLAIFLNQHRRHAPPRQQRPRGQPDRTATDDQHVHFGFRHRHIAPLPRSLPVSTNRNSRCGTSRSTGFRCSAAATQVAARRIQVARGPFQVAVGQLPDPIHTAAPRFANAEFIREPH
jgi:hypothetical protein